MSTVTVAGLIDKAKIILQDTTDPGIRWPDEELLGWLNDSYREIILARPDANTLSADYTCVAGTRQKLNSGAFAEALRLIDVVRNTSGRAIRQLDRSILDDQRRDWHAETGSDTIEHFMFDPRLPREFLVYPPATTSAELEVVYSSVPASHSDQTGVIKLPDSYANAMLDYTLYRAYSKDAEYAANAQRAISHYQAMQSAIGMKSASDIAANPIDVGDKTIR